MSLYYECTSLWCRIAEQAAVMQSLSTRLSALMQPAATVSYTSRHCHYCTHVDQTLSSNDLFFKSQKINRKIYFYPEAKACVWVRVIFYSKHMCILPASTFNCIGIFFYDWLDISCTFHSAWDYSHTHVMRMTRQEGSKQRRAAFNSLSYSPRLSSDPLFSPFVSIVFTTFLSCDPESLYVLNPLDAAQFPLDIWIQVSCKGLSACVSACCLGCSGVFPKPINKPF